MKSCKYLFVTIIALLISFLACVSVASCEARTFVSDEHGTVYYADKNSIIQLLTNNVIAKLDLNIQELSFSDNAFYILVGKEKKGFFVVVDRGGNEIYRSPALGYVSNFSVAHPYIYYIEYDECNDVNLLKFLNIETSSVYSYDDFIKPSSLTISNNKVYVQSLAFEDGYNILSTIMVGSKEVSYLATMPPFGRLMPNFQSKQGCYIQSGTSLYCLEEMENTISISFITGTIDILRQHLCAFQDGVKVIDAYTKEVKNIYNFFDKKKVKDKLIIAGQSASVGVTFLEKIFKKIENANYEKIIEILCFENVETLSNALNERDDIDIAIVSNFDYKQLYFYGSIRDFDFFDKTKLEVFKNKFQGWFLNLCKIDNELYGLPFAYSLPTVWKLEGTNRTDLVHNDKWIWENIRDNKEMCKIAEIYGIDKTPPFLLQKLSQIDKTNYFNFFCDSEFERTCKEWCEIVRKEKKQKSGELNEVTAFAGDPKGLRAMIKLPYFSKVSAGVESLFIAVPQKASITDISMFIDEYYSPEILLSDPVASKDLPILLNYEEYKGKGLTYFTEDEWQYYQTFYVDSYPRNQLIPIEAALANEMKCYMRKEQSFEEMIDKMNEIIIKHMHTYGLLRNGGGKL